MRSGSRSLPRPRRATAARVLLAASSLVGAVALTTTPAMAAVRRAGGAGHSSSGAAPYLLALGDSLAAGYQPSFRSVSPPANPATGLPDQGYPGGYAADLAAARHLRLVDLACPGETTASMSGTPAQRRCATVYRNELGATNQLQAALAFLAAHRHQVALVTIDLGANDLDGCVLGGTIDASCLARADQRVTSRLPAVLAKVRKALTSDDPAARMVGMNYYDPFLAAAYVQPGVRGAAAATLSLSATEALNVELGTMFHTVGVRLADVASTFRTGSVLPLVTYDGRRLPTDVTVVCRWTWMCPSAGSGLAPDIHANATGYARIATAFERALTD